jgi:hypothetical protein
MQIGGAMDFDAAVMAACAYRRSGVSWEWIGRKLGYPREKLRKAAIAQGYGDGWGDSLIRERADEPKASSNGHKMAAFTKARRR